jgi:hypothetical protein
VPATFYITFTPLSGHTAERRFCVRGAERAKTFTAAGQGRLHRWPTVAAVLRRYLSSPA